MCAEEPTSLLHRLGVVGTAASSLVPALIGSLSPLLSGSYEDEVA